MRGPYPVQLTVIETLELRRLLTANLVIPTDLDPGFGEGGHAVTSFDASTSLGRVAALPNAKPTAATSTISASRTRPTACSLSGSTRNVRPPLAG